jgi:hypothetical protein
VLPLIMDSGLPLEMVQIASRRVRMGLSGQVGVKPLYLVWDAVSPMEMDSGLPLDKVQTPLRRVQMELLGLGAQVLPFFLFRE